MLKKILNSILIEMGANDSKKKERAEKVVDGSIEDNKETFDELAKR